MQALDIDWDQGGLQLEAVIMQKEQVDCPVVHRFGPGIYMREVTIPAGTIAVGHHQNFEHLNIVLAGRVRMLNADGSSEIVQAPTTFTSPPGRKIGYIYEDLVWLNVYPTTETDVEKLEAHYLTKSPVAQEHIKGFAKLERTVDREDFKAALLEFGVSAKRVREESERMDDRVDLPPGGYSVQVGPSDIEGKGLFATAPFNIGDTIVPALLGGKRTIAGRFTNHAKEPNAAAVLYANGDIAFVAINPISGNKGGGLGDEITVDYRQVLAIKETLK
jgi:hypothetical protein